MDAMDVAWDRLCDLRLIPLTADEVKAIGKDPKDVVKFPESFGLGQDAHAGRLEAFHQIHCLDTLRREVYFEHYYGKHTLSALEATSDVYTHMWTDGVEHPFPNFSVDHKCRDFESLKDWHERNATDVDNFVTLRAPHGAKIHRISREFKELYGWFRDHEDTGSHGDEIA